MQGVGDDEIGAVVDAGEGVGRHHRRPQHDDRQQGQGRQLGRVGPHAGGQAQRQGGDGHDQAPLDEIGAHRFAGGDLQAGHQLGQIGEDADQGDGSQGKAAMGGPAQAGPLQGWGVAGQLGGQGTGEAHQEQHAAQHQGLGRELQAAQDDGEKGEDVGGQGGQHGDPVTARWR